MIISKSKFLVDSTEVRCI